MASEYSTNLKIELMKTGDQSGTWGNTTNTNLGTALEQAIVGKADITMSSTTVALILTNTNALQDARALYLNLTGSPSGAADLNVPAIQKPYIVKNGSSQQVTIKVEGQTGVAIPTGKTIPVYNNGTDVGLQQDFIPSTVVGITQPTSTNNTTLATTAFVQAVMQTMYPVGSIYTNATNATNPGTLLGFGTWVAFGAGRVMVGLDAGNAAFDTAEETGGSANATLVSHTHTATVTDPGHNHTVSCFSSGGSYAAFSNIAGQNTVTTSTSTTGITVANSTEGSSATNANLQPYIVVYMWKRTA